MAEESSAIYIGDKLPSEDIYHHAATMDKQMVVESAVLAGPVTFTQTVTVTGTLVII
jgi:hypothetical protein|tara:strand:+ start:2484 stop:2654 length:171 start_codon:yes stop_codon:yes gene_type:complete